MHPIFWVLPLENSHNINNNCFRSLNDPSITMLVVSVIWTGTMSITKMLIILWSLTPFSLLCCIRNRFGVFKLFKLDLSFIFCSIGPILNDCLREKSSLLGIHFRVCVFAGYRAHLLTYEPNFWVKWSLGHEKKTHFFVFRNFHFYAFYWHFSIFSLYNISKSLFSSYRS